MGAPRVVTVYHAEGCHLCDRAIEVVREARARVPFRLDLVDIGGVESLEVAYRSLIPVVEIDGKRAFTTFVSAEALVERLETDDGSPDRADGDAGNM